MVFRLSGLTAMYDKFFGAAIISSSNPHYQQAVFSVKVVGDRFNAIVANITAHSGFV